MKSARRLKPQFWALPIRRPANQSDVDDYLWALRHHLRVIERGAFLDVHAEDLTNPTIIDCARPPAQHIVK
jgi:hypothetical protein